MNYAYIRNNDIANGEGVRVSLFVSGCDFHCPGCFNPEAQDFTYGERYDSDVAERVAKMVSEPTISGLSILGGDPLCQDVNGLMFLSQLCSYVRQIGKTVWLWTGFDWEYIFRRHFNGDGVDAWRQILLANCDVVVDGQFREDLADRKLVWRGSANQRVIDVASSIRECSVVKYTY